jgi:hypothetical protein
LFESETEECLLFSLFWNALILYFMYVVLPNGIFSFNYRSNIHFLPMKSIKKNLMWFVLIRTTLNGDHLHCMWLMWVDFDGPMYILLMWFDYFLCEKTLFFLTHTGKFVKK